MKTTLIGTDKDIFPDGFDKLIKFNASKFAVSPTLIKAVAANESMVGKYTQLEKIGGTTGIMHIKLATAQQFNKNLTASELLKPEVDIEYGVRYLQWLLLRYKKYDPATKVKYAVMAYNGGPGRMDEIIKKGETAVKNEQWFKNMTTYWERFNRHIAALGSSVSNIA